jgi:hypothetical protein
MLVAERGKNVVGNQFCFFDLLLKVWKSVERSFWLVAFFSFFFGAVNVIS